MVQLTPATLPPSRRARATIPAVLHDVVRFRELLYELTVRDLRIRYKQSIMGVLWAILTPLMLVMGGAVIRIAFASMAGSAVSLPQMGTLLVKSVGWSFFAGALGFGTASLTANLPLVTKVYFPRELLPLSSVLTQVVDTSVGAMALALLFPIVGIGHVPGLLWLVPLVALLILLTTAAAMLAACANVFYRDARHVVQLVVSLGIFFTPVFFELDSFGPNGARLLAINPLTILLEGARLAVVNGHDLREPLLGASGAVVWSPWFLLFATVWAVGGLAITLILFRHASGKFAEHV